MDKLVLIDGNAIIHRAYHALPKGMSTRAGEQTNAVYGFTTTLIKVLEDLSPKYLACSFDLAGPTFRHEAFEDYKGTRVKADQELYDQIPRVKQIVETFGIPIYEKEGFEADDCLGTIVERTRKERESGELELYIVSGDKDIYQLINGNVFVYSLRKGLSQMQVVDHQTINDEYQLDPEDFIDLKALAGDASDNIPGVPGIGPKTAIDLIQRFDTLKKLYEEIAKLLESHGIISKSEFLNSEQFPGTKLENSKIDSFIENWKLKIENCAGEIETIAKSIQIKSRILQLLITYFPQALLSQHLATIHRDVPIDFNLDKCLFGQYDKEDLRELFEELGFQSLLRRFGNHQAAPTADSSSTSGPTSAVVRKTDEQLKLL